MTRTSRSLAITLLMLLGAALVAAGTACSSSTAPTTVPRCDSTQAGGTGVHKPARPY